LTAARILFVDQTGELGGAELALLDLVGHWRGRCEVALFADGPLRERLERAGVDVRVLSAERRLSSFRRTSALLSTVRTLPGAIRLVRHVAERARRADVVYANSQKAFVVAVAAARLAKRPLVWHLHDLLTASHFSRANRRLVVWLANRYARCVVANSAATAAAFRAAGGAADVVVAYNGIDPAPFEAVDAGAARRALAAEIGCGDAPIVGVFGRLAAWKGQRVAIEAMRRLPGAHLVLVGGALFDEQAYEAELRALAPRVGVAERVHFLGFRDDVAPLMRAVDVVLHTSIAPEPFGRVIVEGMLAGKPVIATAAGGALEIIEDGVTGVLVPPGDAAALSSAIFNLLSQTGPNVDIGRRAMKVATRRFSLATTLDVIDAVIGSGQ
jgi:glycosyltransferase involved in cell wall biosynthesis